MYQYDKEARNLTMLTDFYELTMANGYFRHGRGDTVACFDLFFRKIPDGGGFAITAGLEQAVEYLQSLRFTDADIDFLRSQGHFCEEFLDYLRDFKFCCDVWAIPEGTPVFPHEPIVTVRGPIIQAQFIETMLLLIINHQSLIATKANRIVRAADRRDVVEFGARRAHGADGALYGARAAYIGGCVGSSLTMAQQRFGIPACGTMAHSWIQAFDSELEAFRAYASTYPNDCVLLVDTYNTLHSGVPNAIKAFDDVLKPMGVRPKAIRIDSGDITYLSKKARRMLDEGGYPDCHIMVTNSLDEYLIRDMLLQGAKVDTFGVGERLITSSSSPVFGGVYKLSAVESEGRMVSRVKISDNIQKLTLPGMKTVYRLFDREVGKAIADLITMSDEQLDENQPYELFDPDHTWKRKTVSGFVARRLQQPVFLGGRCVMHCPTLPEIQAYCRRQVEHLWEEVLRFENPHNYYVDLSKKLWDERQTLLERHAGKPADQA